MKSLIFLEEALLDNSQDKISGYFSEIDRQTSNEMMRKAGDQFGFKTMEIMGMRVALLRTASQVLGYSDHSGLTKLLIAYQIFTLKVASVGDEVTRKLREFFELHPKDNESTFITWDGFLVAGMFGQNEEAKKVKLYLLKMETVGRVALSADPRMELAAKNYELKRLSAQITLALKIDKMGDSPFKDSVITDLEQITGRKLPHSAQRQLFKEQKS